MNKLIKKKITIIIDDYIIQRLNIYKYEIVDHNSKYVIVAHKHSKDLDLEEIEFLEKILGAKFISTYVMFLPHVRNCFILEWE